MDPNSPELPKVLVVDDEKVIREILADFLSMEGFWVRTAEDGAAAGGAVRTHYDLVLSDLKMPNMGGLELLEAIGQARAQRGHRDHDGLRHRRDRHRRDEARRLRLHPQALQGGGGRPHDPPRAREAEARAENMRLKEALSLYKVSEAIAASLSLEEVLRTVTDAPARDRGRRGVHRASDGEGGWFERGA
jgi:hypothetical protein